MAVRRDPQSASVSASLNSIRDVEKRLEAYGKFVPHDFLRFLEKKSIVEVKLGDQVLREMTVLFSDIRSFTTLSETMSPQENFNFLNSYLSRVGPEIRAHHGFIDKYIGDAVMGLFPDAPGDGLRAGVAMQRKLVEYNTQRHSSGYQPIAIGVGVHTGKLMLGTVGESLRMDGTVIADAVNLASRLEGLTIKYHVRILTTRDTLDRLPDRAFFSYRFVDRVRVGGGQAEADRHLRDRRRRPGDRALPENGEPGRVQPGGKALPGGKDHRGGARVPGSRRRPPGRRVVRAVPHAL
ncbi:MAG: adenylate/guanylate cyclase domain-containing protein [Spirochaetales bacterium]|nr:adenylate/guanylate cyclase domain-containing protein [Spirochaetales bacterium]